MADGGLRMASPAYHDLMQIGRREIIVAGAAAVGLVRFDARAVQEGREMYGLIGKMTTVPGQRDAFVRILLGGVGDMPGCLSYVVARDPTDENALWITEVWDSEASHKASLSLPAVQQAIAKARPMIAGFDSHIETAPVGGQGLRNA